MGIYFSLAFPTQPVLQAEQPCLLHRAPAPSAVERGYATVVEAKAASERCEVRLDPAGSVEVQASVLCAAEQDRVIGGSPRGEVESSCTQVYLSEGLDPGRHASQTSQGGDWVDNGAVDGL